MCFVASCGDMNPLNSSDSDAEFSEDVPTQTYPIVSSVTPTTAARGATVTINGMGFSSAAPVNIVIVGDTAVSASTYGLVAAPTSSEIEFLTFVVPVGAPIGSDSIDVVVYDNASNSDVTLTVTP